MNIPSNIKYLSEFISELPTNCLFDKGKVGCGGTTLALNSKEKYIIAVPFLSLIQNKISQNPHVTAYPSISNKILVTYDSLHKLIPLINPKEYNLLIDEYHLLFTQYSFRQSAIKSVLSIYDQFKTYCFMTATPVEPDFILDELRHIPVIRANWESTSLVTVKQIQTNNVLQSTKQIITNSHHLLGNLYFFVNSLDFIKQLITSCNLTEENTRIVYSESNKTKLSIPRSSTTSPPKKINFLTSTAFEGSDIYDPIGITYVISDGQLANTLIDISTSFQQIACRIRNSMYNSEITNIFSTTRYSNITYEEFKESSDKTVQQTKDLLSELSNLSSSTRKVISVSAETYLIKSDDIFSFDPNLVKLDLFNFKLTSSYSIRINLTNQLSSFKVKEDLENISIKRTRIGKPVTEHPIFEEGKKYLPIEILLTLTPSQIKKEIVKRMDISKESQTMKILSSDYLFRAGHFISAKDAKDKISNIYKSINMNRTPNIKDYFIVKETTKRNPKVVKGYVIISPKIIID